MNKLYALLTLLFFTSSIHTAAAKDVDTTVTVVNHTVGKKFGTLYSIAKYYNTTPSAIMRLNNMGSTTLVAGETIQVPAKGVDIHMVDPIDKSLWRICLQYKADVDDIMEHNQKKSTNIYVGERIVIPHDYQGVDYNRYTYVKWGKTYQVRTKSLFLEGEQKNEHRIRWYQKRKDNWDLLDEKVVATNATKTPQKAGAAIQVMDFDKNETADVLIEKAEGFIFGFKSYTMYTFDYETDKIKLVKGFDSLSRPAYNEANKRIVSVISNVNGDTSLKYYTIDYKKYSLVARTK